VSGIIEKQHPEILNAPPRIFEVGEEDVPVQGIGDLKQWVTVLTTITVEINKHRTVLGFIWTDFQ
jgi:hypothetical protein